VYSLVSLTVAGSAMEAGPGVSFSRVEHTSPSGITKHLHRFVGWKTT